MITQHDDAERREFGDFVLDPASRELWRSGTRLQLPPHVFQALERLTARPGEVVTRDEMVKLLWPSRIVDFDAGLNSVIRRLRTVLEDDADAPRFIETLPRHGYRFIAPVLRLPDRGFPPAQTPGPTPVSPADAAPLPGASAPDDAPPSRDFADSTPTETIAQRRAQRFLPRIPPVHVFWAATALLVVTSFATFATLRDRKPPDRRDTADAAAAALERTHSLAWSAYQRGRFLTFKHHVKEATAAIAEFNRALELDPNLAEAWSGLAGVYVSMAMFSTRNPDEMERKARDAARRAMELRPDLAEPHVVMGRIAYVFDWDWAAARDHYESALEIDPMNTGALLWLGMLEGNLGQLQPAVLHLERAAELDPASLQIGAFLCKTYVMAREYDHAVAQCRQDLVLDSTSEIATDWLAYAHELRGEDAEAVQTYRDFAQAVRDPEFADEIERIGGAQGMRALRRKWAADELEAAGTFEPGTDMSPARLVWLRLWLGRSREAEPLLKQAYEQRDFFLVWLAMKPETAALAGDPTYGALRARMKLPPLAPSPEAVTWVQQFRPTTG